MVMCFLHLTWVYLLLAAQVFQVRAGFQSHEHHMISLVLSTCLDDLSRHDNK